MQLWIQPESLFVCLFVCLFVWLVCLFVCWLVGWLVGWLFGWLVGWLVACIILSNTLYLPISDNAISPSPIPLMNECAWLLTCRNDETKTKG